MIQRIRNLISAKNLTASAFADRIGVPRSTISHVLSGRNNPSLELVQKILDGFPDININWLIRGSGRMFSEGYDLFSQDSAGKGDVDEGPVDKELSKPEMQEMPDKGRESEEKKDTDNEPEPNISKEFFTGKKKVSRLIIIYRDGSFSEFYPSEQQ